MLQKTENGLTVLQKAPGKLLIIGKLATDFTSCLELKEWVKFDFESRQKFIYSVLSSDLQDINYFSQWLIVICHCSAIVP